ncbi:tryptophan halogenase family protein [Qipengyuania sp. JC766]|uniref:tryptophan halogenase family protein n=1 Tax=Qipengyuania sp. JC766 TaxID=3232139 RepID=UPI00345B450D
MNEEPVTRIVIVGGGTAGWMAAAALSKLTASKITLVESEAIGTVGVGEATIPQIRIFNRALGIDEAEFLRETKGTFKLGIEFAGWTGEGSSYMHAFGNVGEGGGLVPFHHYWLKARASGAAGDLRAYSLNERAARANRMGMWATQPGKPAPDMPWAYHFDASLYARYLRNLAEKSGVERLEGIVAKVEVSAGKDVIRSVRLEDGRTIEGDFFIDCTGFRALLIEGALGAGFEDWSHWLPCDSAVAVPSTMKGEFTPYTRATARPAGWQWRIPLQHRIGNGHVYSSVHMSAEKALDLLLSTIDGEPQAEPNRLSFTTGMRRRQWIGNCLALGLSAGFMEPLESTSIHLIQSSIARFVAMLPGRDGQPALADEFNRQAQFEWTRIRDFLILHYAANGRVGEPFWDACRAMELPDTLSAKIEQFRSAGFIHREHEELFTLPGWLQVFVGQGILPERWHPIADRRDPAELKAFLDRIETQIGRIVDTMPGHAPFLRDYCMPRDSAPARAPETVQ